LSSAKGETRRDKQRRVNYDAIFHLLNSPIDDVDEGPTRYPAFMKK
jgi:hypothetical protein